MPGVRIREGVQEDGVVVKTYLKILATACLLIAAVPLIAIFAGLFFYEGPFSLKQVAIQGGTQFVLFTAVYLIGAAVSKLWGGAACPD